MANLDLILERIYLGELKAEDYYNKYGKEFIDSKLKEIKKSNEEILSQYPSNKMEMDIILKAYKTQKIKKACKRNNYIKIFTCSAAAMLIISLVPTLYFNKTALVDSSATFNSSSGKIRTKGSFLPLNIYIDDSNNISKLKNNDSVKQGDKVQISYNAMEYKYGIIFSVDGNMCVTNHFGSDFKAEKLDNSKEIFLDYSYEFDNAPLFENFFFVTDNEYFELSDLENITSFDEVLTIISSKNYYQVKLIKK